MTIYTNAFDWEQLIAKIDGLRRGAIDPPKEGCTDLDMKQLMIAQDVCYLPQLYIRFLIEFGRGAGQFWRGSHYTYRDSLTLKIAAERDLKIEANYILPNNMFVFFGHQGCAYSWFECVSGDDDPPVHCFIEGDGVSLGSRLSTFLEREIQIYT